MNAKEEILARIRRAARDIPEDEHPEDVAVERGYRKRSEAPREEIVEQFAERVAEYKATVHRAKEGDLTREIQTALKRRGVESLVIPPGLPNEWIPDSVKVLYDGPDGPLSNEQLNSSGGVLTGCALGIAQSGTIALDAGPAQGRRALTLLPDYHLCVVREDRIVGLVPEAFARLEDTVRDGSRAITFISGPSATSDIELERVEGVHGPRTLEVLIIRGV